MNDELWAIMSGFGAGLVLGVVFFGGLAMTLRRLPATRHPVLLVLGSFFTRIIVVTGGLVLVAGGDWRAMVAGLGGLMAMRIAYVRLWRPPADLAVASPEGKA